MTGKEGRKKIDEEDDDFDSNDSDRNENKQYNKGYCIMKDVGTDPDNELFDLVKIEKDLVFDGRLIICTWKTPANRSANGNGY